MRKILALVLVFVLLLSACTDSVSKEQSIENFAIYAQELMIVSEKNGYEMIENEELDALSSRITIELQEGVTITSYFSNSATSDGKSQGGEQVEVYYDISSAVKSEGTFNLELFTEVVNISSGEKIDVEMCEEFLDAPESKYSFKKVGLEKTEDMRIAKHKFLDFWENWCLVYEMNQNGDETLYFSGLTKKSK